MEPCNVFEHVIWKGHYDGDLSNIRNRSLQILTTSNKLNAGLERDGGRSSSSDPDAPHKWPEIDPFINWLVEPVQHILPHWNYFDEKIQFGSSWVNIHPTGAWTDEHQHGSVPLVVVLYIEQPKDGGNLEVFDPLFYNWSGTPGRTPNPWREIVVQTGDVIIFPGWILHRTQKNASDQNRIVASFNIKTA